MRIVLDTMVYISGATLSHSPSSQILQLWAEQKLEIAVSEPILVELRRVINYPQIRRLLSLSDAQIARYVQKIRQGSYLVEGITPTDISPDPDDNKFFACAVEADASFIVSKDKHHVLPIGSYRGIQVIRPDHFIEQQLWLRQAA